MLVLNTDLGSSTWYFIHMDFVKTLLQGYSFLQIGVKLNLVMFVVGFFFCAVAVLHFFRSAEYSKSRLTLGGYL